MNDDIAIKVDGVSKSFKLPHEKSGSIKGALVGWRQRKRGYENQHVLKDVSFEIKKGEFFGIVGRNGSGKSTLLKLISQIYTPDKGTIQVNGKLTPFIELGVGFNPELSGRDNVYLNGALLGFSRKEMEAMYDEVVEFAELGRFMDQKLKNYSSGMQVRLAFSIAIRANTDILVLDEVLAVGDSNFQKKCFDYFAKVKRDKKTIVLVTHDMSAVERFCDRAVLIDVGSIVAIGKPPLITQEYSDLNFTQSAEAVGRSNESLSRSGASKAGLEVDVMVRGDKAGKQSIHADEAKIRLTATLVSERDIRDAKLGIIVSNSGGTPIFATNTLVDGRLINLTTHSAIRVEYVIDNIFANGVYDIAATLRSEDGNITYYTNDVAAKFAVGGRRHDYAITSPGYKLTID